MRKIIFKLLLFFISITNSKGQFISEPGLSYPLVVSATKSGWIYSNATLLSDKQKSYTKNEKINVISDHNLLWLITESGGFIEKSNVVYKSPERLENERIENERLQIERNVRIENQRVENEKQAIAQRIENERLLNEKIQKIKINSNFLKWTKGDKICNQIKNGVLMGVIDDWNENKSKVKLKIIAGPEGNYEAEPIVQGSYIWASTVGKGWHLCLDDEIEKAVENNKSISNSTVSSSYSSSSSSSNSNNAEMKRRLNLQRPCKLKKGEVTDWSYSDPNESPNWRYLKFTVYKPRDNDDYEEIDAELEYRVYRAGGGLILSRKTDEIYYLVSKPNGSSARYEKAEDALERMIKNCGCENGIVMK